MSPKTTGTSIKPRFYYHGEGHALSGEFRRPIPFLIEGQASASLSTIGGHARGYAENFNAHNMASFKVGHTHVSGSRKNDKIVTTHTTTVIEHLNILDVVTADRIVVRLTSQHEDDDKGNHQESHIIAMGTHFDNLRIAGFPVNVILRHELFIESENFAKLHKRVAGDKDSGKIAVLKDQSLLCSLVEKIETKLPGVDGRSHIIVVPHFGQVSIAEVFAEPGNRVLTMLRMDLGSPADGTLTAGENRINGQPWP